MMSLEQFVIVVYCMVDDLYGAVVGNVRLRARGPAPGLSDVDVIVMEIVGEFLGYHHDEKLWVYSMCAKPRCGPSPWIRSHPRVAQPAPSNRARRA